MTTITRVLSPRKPRGVVEKPATALNNANRIASGLDTPEEKVKRLLRHIEAMKEETRKIEVRLLKVAANKGLAYSEGVLQDIADDLACNVRDLGTEDGELCGLCRSELVNGECSEGCEQ